MTTPEPEAVDEAMRGMGDPADYDDWAEEAPDREQRLTELVTQLAEYLGLSVGRAEPVAPRDAVAHVELHCVTCAMPLSVITLGTAPGMTSEWPVQHYCKQPMEVTPGNALVVLTLTLRSGT